MEDQNKTEGLFNLSLDLEAKSTLKTISVWAKIVAITAFVQSGVSLVTSLVGTSSGVQVAGTIFVSIIGITISVVLNVFLFRFGHKTGSALTSSNQQSFVEGVNSLRNYFKVLGIVIIVLLSLCILMFIFFFISFGLAGGR